MKYDLYRGYLHTVPADFGSVKVFVSKADALADNPAYIGMAEMNALEWIDDQPEGFVGSEDLNELNKVETVTPNYPAYIMEKVRQHHGLEFYDTSRDEEINNMSHSEVFRHCLEWEGIMGYDVAIASWIHDIHGVVLR